MTSDNGGRLARRAERRGGSSVDAATAGGCSGDGGGGAVRVSDVRGEGEAARASEVTAAATVSHTPVRASAKAISMCRLVLAAAARVGRLLSLLSSSAPWIAPRHAARSITSVEVTIRCYPSGGGHR